MAGLQAVTKVADSMMGKKDVSQTATRPHESDTETMKAVVYLAPKKVGVETKAKPMLTDPHDVIIKVRSISLCTRAAHLRPHSLIACACIPS